MLAFAGFCVNSDESQIVVDGTVLATEEGTPSDAGPVVDAFEVTGDPRAPRAADRAAKTSSTKPPRWPTREWAPQFGQIRLLTSRPHEAAPGRSPPAHGEVSR